ncbi:MAG: hypothetical protein ABIJ24_04555 [Nitrospinota bacterium]|nr:hypothetical protein [Nitrospinota bacterium]
MNDKTESQSLSTPLFGLLGSLGHSEFRWYHHFDTGTLFWSLTRLFGFYHRIILSLQLQREQRVFLDSDIESFIIRMRIVLNDTAFIIRQLLPKNEQGLKGPKGGVHPRNKEMSMMDIFKYIEKNPNDFHEFTNVLKQNRDWIFRLRDQRDNIIHYKSKVIIFETEPNISFAMLNAAGTEVTEPTEDGGQRVVTTPIFEYINSQTLSLHKFLHVDLVSAIEQYIKRSGMKFSEVGENPRMTCMGIPLFKEINSIET